MAERRYNQSDQQKMMRDFMADARARGADFKACHVTSDDGTIGAIKEMKKDLGYTIAQSQAWTEHNVEKAKNINKPQDPE